MKDELCTFEKECGSDKNAVIAKAARRGNVVHVSNGRLTRVTDKEVEGRADTMGSQTNQGLVEGCSLSSGR